MNQSLFALLEKTVADSGRRFLTDATGTTVTYGELLDGARRYAAALAELGVEPGDRIAVQTDKTVQSVYLYLGTLAAGAVYLPLNAAYTAHEVEYFLNDAEPTVLVCASAARETLTPVAQAKGVRYVMTLDTGEDGTIVDAAAAQAPRFTTVERAADDLAAILYTSGTTGRSKGAMLSHANLSSNALTLIDAWRITADDCLLHALPIYHTHGLFVAIGSLMLAGGSLIYLPRFDADQVIRWLPDATMMMGVPTFYSRLLAEPAFTRELVAHMRVFISGSAPLSSPTHAEFAARTGHAILERYGMTETNMNTSNPYDGERRAGTVGMPLTAVESRIADPETGAPLPSGEAGVIEVRGPNVFAGYWRNDTKTKEAFRPDGFFITGDVGRVDADGYLSIVGRDKDLIISGGFNVYPAEVETVIDALDGVAESAVVGAPHADFGEAVVAVVAQRPGAALSDVDIVTPLQHQLAAFKRPKKVFFVDALPRNTMGKVQKNVLRETYAAAFTEDGGGPSC